MSVSEETKELALELKAEVASVAGKAELIIAKLFAGELHHLIEKVEAFIAAGGANVLQLQELLTLMKYGAPAPEPEAPAVPEPALPGGVTIVEPAPAEPVVEADAQ